MSGPGPPSGGGTDYVTGLAAHKIAGSDFGGRKPAPKGQRPGWAEQRDAADIGPIKDYIFAADNPGMFDGADTVVLYEELAFQDVLPVIWRVSPGSLEPDTAAGLAERNLQVLQAWDAMEEHGPVEKPDENNPYAADILRLERKMNLLLDLVGQILAANRPRPALASVRFNALGAVWRGTPPLPEAGAQGVLEVYLHDCLAQPLRLPGRVTSVTPDGNVKARFIPLGEAIADLIEKMAFRRHRRQIAGTRTSVRLTRPNTDR